jgi:putative addiction module CopG family antidote
METIRQTPTVRLFIRFLNSDMIKSYSSEELAMRTTQALSITLPLEMAQMVKDKVASGEYASESEVIRDGLRALAAQDAAIEKWLREEVVPTIRRLEADPTRAIPIEEARRRIWAHIEKREKDRSGRQ